MTKHRLINLFLFTNKTKYPYVIWYFRSVPSNIFFNTIFVNVYWIFIRVTPSDDTRLSTCMQVNRAVFLCLGCQKWHNFVSWSIFQTNCCMGTDVSSTMSPFVQISGRFYCIEFFDGGMTKHWLWKKTDDIN